MKTVFKMMVLAAALTLAACGGSSKYHEQATVQPTTPPTTTPPVTTPPVSMVDAFFTAVMGIIGDGKETTTEPVATDSIAATTPDNSEPVTVN